MKLADWKRTSDLTDEGLAELIGDCTVSALQKWYRDERIPRKDQMQRIFDVTRGQVTPNDFYALTPERPDGSLDAIASGAEAA